MKQFLMFYRRDQAGSWEEAKKDGAIRQLIVEEGAEAARTRFAVQVTADMMEHDAQLVFKMENIV